MSLTVRSRALEFGMLPLNSVLPDLRKVSQVQEIAAELMKDAVQEDGWYYCTIEKVGEVFGLSSHHARAVLDILDGISPYQVIRTGINEKAAPEGTSRPGAARYVDCHALSLFLMTQLYETVQKRGQELSAKSVEVWPVSQGPPSPSGPRSPGALPGASFKAALEQTLVQYVDFIKTYAETLLAMCTDDPAGTPVTVTRAQVDHLSLLLQLEASVGSTATDSHGSIASALPMFRDSKEAPASEVVQHIQKHLVLPVVPRPDPGAQLQALAPAEDISGTVKETVVRGEDACPSGTLRIVSCQDSHIYALVPVHYCTVYGCSNCVIVVGAVGRFIRLERCEDVKLIVACKRIAVSSCHNCTLYLGTNRPPYLLGDTRGIQVAPYCTRYERLQAHMDAVRVASLVNLWDQPLSLVRHPRSAAPDSPKNPRSPASRTATWAADATVPPQAQALPPDALMPFIIPFRGGPGRVGGGVPSTSRKDDGALGSSAVGVTLEPGVFPLPPEYASALDRKLRMVSELRNAVRGADLTDAKKVELQMTVQMWFKDWLTTSGNMKVVHDIAKLEKAATNPSASRARNARGPRASGSASRHPDRPSHAATAAATVAGVEGAGEREGRGGGVAREGRASGEGAEGSARQRE